MDSEDQEQTLLKIIGKFQKLVDEFHKNTKTNMSVVLLVGVTGSGKSTIFNFQCGADFIINDKKELEIMNPQNIFSKMVGGMNSITKEPNFNRNVKNNHLIIDFPGFQDTNGEWDQLLFELLFYKIVTSGPIKVIYVIKNPENSLPNRGSDLQEFIRQLFLQRNINIQKFNILLNCYLEDLSEEELKNKIKEDLRSVNLLQSIDKILVLRKAKRNEEIQHIFNNEQRQMLWQQIEQMQSIKIKPKKLPKSEIISEYLVYTTLKKIEKYGSMLCEIFDSSYLKLSDAQSDQTYTQMKKLLDVINSEKKESPLDWYINFISVCEQLANNLSFQIDIVTSSNNFRKIFTYFSQFSNLIKGYDEMKIMKSIAQDQLKKIENIIGTRLELLRITQQNKQTINKIEQEKLKLQQSLNDFRNRQEQLELNLQDSQVEHQIELDKMKKQQEITYQKYCDLEAKHAKELKSQKETNEKNSIELNQQFNELKKQFQELKQNDECNTSKVRIYENKINQQQMEIEILRMFKNKPCQIF